MRWLNDLVVRVSQSLPLFLLAVAVAASCIGWLFPGFDAEMERLTGYPLLDMQNDLATSEVAAQISAYDREARQLYVRFSLLDFLFPVCIAVAMAAAFAWASRAQFPRMYERAAQASLFALLLIPAAFDWLENVFALLLIGGALGADGFGAAALVAAKRAKLTTIVVSQGCVMAGLIGAGARWAATRIRAALASRR